MVLIPPNFRNFSPAGEFPVARNPRDRQLLAAGFVDCSPDCRRRRRWAYTSASDERVRRAFGEMAIPQRLCDFVPAERRRLCVGRSVSNCARRRRQFSSHTIKYCAAAAAAADLDRRHRVRRLIDMDQTADVALPPRTENTDLNMLLNCVCSYEVQTS